MATNLSRRRPRTDARRNAERIVGAASTVFIESGVDVSLEEIAHRAGLGVATLYRHFATKHDLVHAVAQQAFSDEVEPALRLALGDGEDALAGLVSVLEAALTLSTRHRNAFAASRQPGRIPLDLAAPFFEQLSDVLKRAQAQGSLRADLHPDDLPRLMAMLVSLTSLDESPGTWRRYLALLMDGLRPSAAHPLPAVAPIEQGSTLFRPPLDVRGKEPGPYSMGPDTESQPS